ncbi:MAG: hypothetical protein HY321_12530 [Armatimonadetes bacterium]|nr:hypothetical protein [Armatimonadota bacterium]
MRHLALAVGVATGVLVMTGCSRIAGDLPSLTGPCSETVKHADKSPDGRYTAVVFERDCGATTDYVMHVNLREGSRAFREERSGVIREGSVFVREGRCHIGIRWKDSRTLVVTAPKDDVFQRARAWRGMSIIYDEPGVAR